MTIKSVVDIDLDDAKFKRFTQLYGQYEAALRKQPGEWQKAEAGADATSDAVNKVLAAFLATGQFHREMNEENDKDNKALKKKATLWEQIGKSSKGVLKDVGAIAKFLLGFGGIVLGAGIAGFFGLRGIARDVSDQRNQALGLDLAVGQRDAFARHQGRNLNTDALLQGAYAARSDNSSPAYQVLAAFGIDPRNKSTVDVANALLLKVQALAKDRPLSQVGYLLQQFKGLSDFGFDRQGLQTLRGLSTQELQSQIAAFGPDARNAGLNDKQAQAFQNFSTSVDQTFASVTKQIERDLIPLLGPIQRFVKDLGDTFSRFLRGKVAKEGLEQLSQAIDHFAAYMESGAFKQDVADFSDGVGHIAASFHFLAHPAGDTKDAATDSWHLFQDWAQREKDKAHGIAPKPGFVADMRQHLAERRAASIHAISPTGLTFPKPLAPVKVQTQVHLKVSNATGSNINASVNQLGGGV